MKPILKTIMIVSIVTFMTMKHIKICLKTDMAKKCQKCKSYTWQSESNSRIFQP